jgi:DNA-binding MarR family transcriptional regulator
MHLMMRPGISSAIFSNSRAEAGRAAVRAPHRTLQIEAAWAVGEPQTTEAREREGGSRALPADRQLVPQGCGGTHWPSPADDLLTHSPPKIRRRETPWWLEEQLQAPNQLQLAGQAGVDARMASQVVRKLEAKNLVQREVDRDDTRARRVRLTAEGRDLVMCAIPAVEQADSDFFGAETAAATSLLQRMIGHQVQHRSYLSRGD